MNGTESLPYALKSLVGLLQLDYFHLFFKLHMYTAPIWLAWVIKILEHFIVPVCKCIYIGISLGFLKEGNRIEN